MNGFRDVTQIDWNRTTYRVFLLALKRNLKQSIVKRHQGKASKRLATPHRKICRIHCLRNSFNRSSLGYENIIIYIYRIYPNKYYKTPFIA